MCNRTDCWLFNMCSHDIYPCEYYKTDNEIVELIEKLGEKDALDSDGD